MEISIGWILYLFTCKAFLMEVILLYIYCTYLTDFNSAILNTPEIAIFQKLTQFAFGG